MEQWGEELKRLVPTTSARRSPGGALTFQRSSSIGAVVLKDVSLRAHSRLQRLRHVAEQLPRPVQTYAISRDRRQKFEEFLEGVLKVKPPTKNKPKPRKKSAAKRSKKAGG